MKCFYHSDMDGRCAGFWVYHSYPAAELALIEVDYKDRFPLEIIAPQEEVWIVDFSLEPEGMKELLARTDRVTWIDHHKTAIAKYDGFKPHLPGIRQDGVAACVLTCLYARGIINSGDRYTDEMEQNVPWFTRLVGDRDIWRWRYGKRTKDFHAGLELSGTDPEAEVWAKLLAEDPNTAAVEECGSIVNRYKEIRNYELVHAFGFECEFEGYRAICCNVGRTSSELFEQWPTYDVMIPFYWDGRQWTVSLYSTTVDVSEIARRYGGGGHRGASGFTCKELPAALRAMNPVG